jgi:serine phosphatase RsbU (regulator of sigma subunit)
MRGTWRSKLTISRVLTWSVGFTVAACALASGFFAVREIYYQKTKDTWALVYLQLEREAARLALAVKARGSSDSAGASTYQQHADGSMDLLAGPDLQLKHSSQVPALASDKDIVLAAWAGRTYRVRRQSTGDVQLLPLDLTSLVRSSGEIRSDMRVVVVTRSSDIVYSELPDGMDWLDTPLVRQYISSPLWQGQFEFVLGERRQGFFQEIPGSNLVYFVDLPFSTIRDAVADPTLSYIGIATLVLVLALAGVRVGLRFLTVPIRQLVEATEQIGQGDFRIKAQKSIGEFAAVFDALEKMSQNLELRDVQVTALMKQKEQAARLEGEMKLARSLQESFIPNGEVDANSRLLTASYYQSSSEVAGDWFQYRYDATTGKTCVVVVDVSGHGAAPSMLTAMIAGIFSEVCHSVDDQCVDKFFRAVNRAMLQVGRSKWHATGCGVVFDPLAAKATIVNAGHQFPFVRPAAAKNWISQRMPSDLLGLDEVIRLNTQVIEVKSGTRICMYTDGLVEARGQAGEALGRRAVKDALERSETAELSVTLRRVIAEWRLFLGNADPGDDTCVVLVEVA